MPVATRNPSDSDFGTAEPPQGMARKLDTSRPSRRGKTPIQIVGTPAATVTRSDSMRSTIADGERSGPGNTRLAPAKTAACARPHALAWNIGTTGSTTSASDTPSVSASITDIECRNVERCEYTTPLGLPVVPLV